MEIINTKILHEKDTLNPRIPDDIIENILIRLPVKSLLRFKAVSGKWEATISDPIFARTHLHQSKITSSRQYIFGEEINDPAEQVCGQFKLIRLKNQEFRVELALDHPQEFGDAYFMCYLDGLLLLQCYNEVEDPCSDSLDYSEVRHYVLWNPSMETFIMFKCPYSIGWSPMLYGICYDPLIEHYKVVIGDGIHYAVLNCRNKCWTGMKKLPFNGKSYRTDPPGVYFNGSLYWVLNKHLISSENFGKFKIVRFDPRDDKFKKVQKPKGLQNGHNPLFLVLLGDHLCLYYFSMVKHLFIVKKDDDQDSWIEFIIIDNMPSQTYPQPLFMINENEIILDVNETSENLVVYNLSNKTFVKINTSIELGSNIFFPFVESLMLDTRRDRGYRRAKAFEELREVFFLM